MKTSVRVQSEATSICGAHSENETKTEPGHRHRRMRRGRERENAEKNKRQRNANCNTHVHTHTRQENRIEYTHVIRVVKTNAERARLFFCVVIFFLCWCCYYYFVKRSFFGEEEDATDDDGTRYRCKPKKRSLSTTHTTVHWRMTKVLAASCCGGLARNQARKA